MQLEHLSASLLFLGFVPWHISYKQLMCQRKKRTICQVEAIFWQLRISVDPNGRKEWEFKVSLLNRISAAVWLAVRKLANGDKSQE